MRIVPSFLAASLVALSATPAAFAATSTANMTISIQVATSCTVAVTNINFGLVSASSLTAQKTSTTGGVFTYTCPSSSTAPVLTASQGDNFSGTNRMKGTATGEFLPYSLTIPTLAAPNGAQQTATIRAVIPAQATAPVGDTYSDTVTLTLTY